MNYIVYDLEWNQPASYDTAVVDPIYLSGEIIEIGAVKLNETFQSVDEFKIYVSPQYYTKIHNEIVALTGIHDRDLSEKGLPFPDAYAQFLDWCGEEYSFMTWSMNDLPVLIDNMILHNLNLSSLPDCYDVQRIFSREIMRGETRYSLETALALLKESGDVSHDALNDARNTVKICNHLNLDQYLQEYTSRVFAEYPSNVLYETKHRIFTDTSLQEFICPWCGQTVKAGPWVCLSRNTHVAYGVCPDGDEFLVQLSIVHRGKRSFSVKRIIFEMSDDLWDIYMDKKESYGK